MATTSEARALPYFTDLFGRPLESGSIYIGQPGLDPISYPISVSSDQAGTVVLKQPIRTIHGGVVSGGARVHMYCQVPFSITVLDSAGRVVYASLNETDPILTAFSNSSVQSASDLPTLRARTGTSTNQVWVTGFGMYVYVPTDTTSPESIPFVIVGSDGSRYYLDYQYLLGHYAKLVGTAQPIQQGLWLSWNDDTTGSGFLSNNCGTGAGGIVFRNVNASNTSELGRVTVTSTGGLNTSQGISTEAGDIKAAGNLYALNGTVGLNSSASRALSFDGTNYQLPSSDLYVNGSKSITQAGLLANQIANGVGAVALGTNTGPNPTLPGTWTSTGSASNSVYLWTRSA